MHRLLYTSTACLGQEGPILELAQRSARRNAASGLTGMLLHVEGSFIQVLEGKLDRIEEVFERICCDFRHCDVHLVDLAPVESRKFADWSMAFVEGDGDADGALMNDLQGVTFLVGVNAVEAVREMRDLLDRHAVSLGLN